jgi:acyl transferase domain-containing protein
MTAQHWVDQARHTVRYHDAAQALADHGIASLLEVGPDGQLAALADDVPATSTLRQKRPDPTTLVTALAHTWAHGTHVDWATLHPRPDHPVDLPTYPFQHHRYWPTPEPTPAPVDWRYRIDWAPLDPTPEEPRLAGRWVVLTSSGADAGLAAWCVDALRRAGADAGVETVTDPASLGARLSQGVGGVLSVLATDASPATGSPAVTNGLAVTLAVVQALEATGAPTAGTLWCVTRGAVATGRADPVTSPGQAAVWGLGRVAGLEHPGLWGGLVDLPDRLDGVAARALLEALAADDAEDQVAVRAGRRLARRLVRAPVPTGGSTSWAPSGTALVTGGTGALGAHVARWLAANGAEHLVLVSRRGVDAPGAAPLAAELAAAGAGVTLLRADVADRGSLAEALTTLDPALPPVRVIVHAAGVGEDRPLAELDVAGLAYAAGAKAGGARHLHELAGERWPELERFVVFSSGAAVWGGAAQGAYAAANAYVDALVEQRRAGGQPATSVAWGPWAGSGMAEGDTGEHLRRLGVHEMGVERATRALVQALAHHEVTLTVADIDWERFAPAFAAARRRPLLEGVPEAARALHPPADAGPGDGGAGPAGTELGRRLAGLAEDEATQAVVDLVRVEVAAVLAYAAPGEVDAGRAFKDLGFDSVTAVELRNRLGAVTGLRLPATSVFDYPTPAALAREIGRRLVPHRSPRTPGHAALDHLDQVAAALVAPGTEWAPEDREQLRLGLRQLLSRLTGSGAEGGDPGGRQQVEEHLLAADDDELFAFIDRRLGTPDP